MSSKSKRRVTKKVEVSEEEESEVSESEEPEVSEEEEEEVSEEEEEEESEEEETPPPPKKRGRPPKSAAKKAPAKKTPAKGKAPAKGKKAPAQDGGKRKFKVMLETVRSASKGSPKPDSKKLSAGGGHYTGNNPMQAAKKAFTRICRSVADGGTCSYIFSIKETTRGSKGKQFTYRGERTELDKPKELKKGDSTFKIRFTTSLKAHKETK